MPGKALKPNPFDSQQQPTPFSAYARCLDFETRSLSIDAKGSGVGRSPLICARILGWLLVEAPVCDHLAPDISKCKDDDELKELANLLDIHVIQLFKSHQGHSTQHTSHPSNPNYTLELMAKRGDLVKTPDGRASKKSALERDGYRCMISGAIDRNSYERGKIAADGKSNIIATHRAHIFPQSVNKGIENHRKKFYLANVHSVMEMFGISSIVELNGAKVHRLENILTLAIHVHNAFDELDFWLEKKEGDVGNWYTITTHDPAYKTMFPDRVEFTTPDPVKFPLPDPRYLAMHAACVRVLHLSGAAEQIDEVLDDWDDIDVLASDGSSAPLFYQKLVAAF